MSRLQFAFTITYHYLFPQLTMGLALLIVVLKTLAVRHGDETYNQAVRFWTRIFAISFVIGVVTGIPMEFQFGTNWARFSAYAGNVIAQTLAMEGAFAFFLESAFLGMLLFGERRFGQRVTVDACADGRERNRLNRRVLGRQFQAVAVTIGKKFRLAVAAAVPDWADCVDDVFCGQVKAGRDACLASRASHTGPNFGDGFARFIQAWTSRAMNRAIDATAAQHPFVGGVDDGVNLQRRDVGLHRLNG
jgi:hypothetical protein